MTVREAQMYAVKLLYPAESGLERRTSARFMVGQIVSYWNSFHANTRTVAARPCIGACASRTERIEYNRLDPGPSDVGRESERQLSRMMLIGLDSEILNPPRSSGKRQLFGELRNGGPPGTIRSHV